MSVTEPSPPSTLIFVPNDSRPGVYLVPSDVFHPAYFKITPLFHHMFTSVDHLLAAVLTLILLTILTSAAHTILLRTTSHNADSPLPSRTRLLSAALLSDIFHLRLPLYLFRRQPQSFSHARAFNPRPPPTLPPLPVPVILAIAVFVTTLALASINLLVLVVASYTRPTSSTRTQYALHGIQPIFTSTTTSRRITRPAIHSICTSPVVASEPVTLSTSISSPFPLHRYLLTTCVYTDTIKSPTMKKRTKHFERTSITSTHLQFSFSSTFHSDGADHTITIGNKTIVAHVRVTISHINIDGSVVRNPMPFRTLNDDVKNNVQYLHERAAYFVNNFISGKSRKYKFTHKENPPNALQRDDIPKSVRSKRKNPEKTRPVERMPSIILRHQLRLSISQRTRRVQAETIFLVERSERQSGEEIEAAHEAALDSLIPTMGIIEAEGGSSEALKKAVKRYLNVNLNQTFGSQKKESEELQDSDGTSYVAEGLVQQEGRTAGVVFLGFMAVASVVVMAALRWRFRPTSLGELAWQHLEGVQSRREWLASHPQRSRNEQETEFSKDTKNDAMFGNSDAIDRNSSQVVSQFESDNSTSSIGIDATIRRSMSVYVCPPTDI